VGHNVAETEDNSAEPELVPEHLVLESYDDQTIWYDYNGIYLPTDILSDWWN
jgi:hypothetical protein